MANKPYTKIKIFGPLSLVFWENEKEKDGKKFKTLDPFLTRSVYNENTKAWSNQAIPISFNALFRFMALNSKLKVIEDNYKEEQKKDKVSEENVG